MKVTRFKMLVIVIMSVMCSFANDTIMVKDIIPQQAKVEVNQRKRDKQGVFCTRIEVHSNDTTLKVIKSNLGIFGDSIDPFDKKIRYYWISPHNQILYLSADHASTIDYRIKLNENSDQNLMYRMEVDVVNKETIIEREKSYPFYISGGFNVVSIMGPSLALGYHFGNYNVEAGLVVGFNSSSDQYFYKKGEPLQAAHSYKAIRVYLRGGYDFKFNGTDFLTVEPQVGLAFNAIRGGKNSKNFQGDKDSYMKNLGSISALAAVRFKFAINSHLKFHVTPEFDLGVGKNDNVKDLNNADSKIKSWTDGLNLNVGLMLYL